MRFRFKPIIPVKFFFYRVISVFYYLLESAAPSKIKDYKQIPIIINNFNRLDSIKRLIESLEIRGYTNIFIIDNLSTYPPLLEYYKTCSYKVFYLKKNLGMEALWASGIYKTFKKDFFVYTDPDVVPVDECPADFLLFFLETLKKYKLAQKAGFSLKIDDLPDCYAMKKDVIDWEKQFFDHKRGDLLYWAPIDTTFALYRPRGKKKHAFYSIEMYRTAFPYMARHLPWYINSENPEEEERYYFSHTVMKTRWSEKGKEYFFKKT
jgi:hypothetical protein